MNRIIRKISVVCSFWLIGFSNLFCQGFSHKGTEFIFPNIHLASYQIITDNSPAIVTVEDYGYATTTVYNIPSDTCYQLPLYYGVSPSFPFSRVLSGVGFTISSHSQKIGSVRITSNTPIYVQAQEIRLFGFSNRNIGGMSSIKPTKYCTNKAAVYIKNRPDSVSSPSHCIIVTSFQDSTDIEVKPTHNSGHGWKKDSTYIIRLDEGESYTVPFVIPHFPNPHLDATYNNNDFSGTTFTALNPCHKINLVTSGVPRILLPQYASTSITGGDVLLEEIPLAQHARKTYFVVPEMRTNLPDLIHVHATQNNTQVFFDGQYVTTLQKYDQWDTLYDKPAKIQGSNPILISQYFVTKHFSNDTIAAEMFFVQPIQFRTSNFYFFYNFNDANNRQLSIVTDSFNRNTFTLDGVPISGNEFEFFDSDSSMIYLAKQLPQHPVLFQPYHFRLKSTGTFQAWASSCVHNRGSQVFLSPLDSVVPEPPVPPYYMDTCLYDTVPLEGKESAIGWLWNTGDTTLQINIHTAGTYWVQNFYCTDTIVDTFDITGFLYAYERDSICYGDSIWFKSRFVSQPGFHYDTTNHIGSCDTVFRLNLSYYNPIPTDTVLSDTICKRDSLKIGAIIYTQTGQYTDTLHYSNGCDSLYILAEIYVSEDTTFLFDTICDNETVSFGVNSLNSQGIFYHTLPNSIGCDSIIVLDLTVNPTHYFRYDTSFCIKDSVLVINQIISEDGINSFPFLNQFGCDSLIEVNIVNYCPNIAFIPNSFTPNEDGDNEEFLPVFVNQDEITNYELLIFNRWGELLFQTDDVYQSWDGKHKNTSVPLGVYIWKIRYQANGETKELIGHVQVLK